MKEQCTVCAHPAVEEIDLRLSQGTSLRSLADAFPPLSYMACQRHRMHALPRAWSRLRKRELARGNADPGEAPVEGWMPGMPLPTPPSLRLAATLPDGAPPQAVKPGLSEQDEKIADLVDGIEAMRRNRRTAVGMIGVAGRYVLILDDAAKRIEKMMAKDKDHLPQAREIAALAVAAGKLARVGMENLRDGYDLLKKRTKEGEVLVGPAPGTVTADEVAERMRRIERTRRMLLLNTTSGAAAQTVETQAVPTPEKP